MSASFNRTILVGNLVYTPELNFGPSGQAFCQVTLAVNRRKKNDAGEWVEAPEFIGVQLFGKPAEIVAEYAAKGSSVLVEGRLERHQVQIVDKAIAKLRVIGERIQLLGGVNRVEPSDSPERSGDFVSAHETQVAVAAGDPDDSIPF